ncbi:hypothetical protein RI129_003016 [Pyrocoelia pectoralis]|uniref:Putative nuclease HARBI1 n=1 Tax=Pyrocoelia pectoralis TaxID=417401 RepID=A0AAN7VQV3_9COLE
MEIDLDVTLFSSSSSSSSSSEDDVDVFLNAILPFEHLQDCIKNELFVEETVQLYSDEQFTKHFRLSRKIVDLLKAEFETSEYFPKKDTGFTRVTSEKCILAFLWFIGNEGATYRDVADRFNLSMSTLHGIIEKVTYFLSNRSKQFIVWPSIQERVEIESEFANMGFPGAIGVIDGTHIKIDRPAEDSESYLNKKKYHSIHMQIICDDKRKIRDVFVGYPGSVYDARVFRKSPISQSLPELCQNFYILGDSAYPCLVNLLTPYKDTGNVTNEQKNFNLKLSRCRILIEHTIGLLKQRFRQLFHIKCRSIELTCHIIRACCVLHNLCIENDVAPNAHHEEMEAQDVDLQENNEEDEDNHVGLNYRNYVAAMLHIRCVPR